MTQDKQRTFILFLILPLILAPILVFAHQYQVGLSEYDWFSSGSSAYDFFLYFKSRFLILTGAVFLVLIIYRWYTEQNLFFKYLNPLTWCCITIYAILIILSCLFAQKSEMAFQGGFEQFEGGLVLLTYLLLLIYSSTLNIQKNTLHLYYTIIGVGVGIVSGVGALQALNADFFQTELGQTLMKMFESSLAGQSLRFNFGEGRTYAMQYNPNYIGSYVALLLPIIIAGAIVLKKIWQKLIMGILSLCLILSLIGSESLTGALGIGMSILLVIFLLLPKFRFYKKFLFTFTGCSLILLAIILLCKPDVLKYGYNKLFKVPESNYRVQNFENKDGKLLIHSGSNVLTVDYNTEKQTISFYENEKAMNNITQSEQLFQVEQGAFKSMQIQPNTFTTYDQKTVSGLTIKVDEHSWNLVKQDDSFMFLNTFLKLDEIRKIEAFGFENTQHFGSRRGYIWSRTLPLIKNNIFWGAGPDQFVLAFPNDDYVGLENNNYTGSVVTKPHNMFLQIAIQTGLFSLLAFIVLYGWYAVKSIGLYLHCKHMGALEITGIGIFIGTFGYFITGLANDSSVTVAPVFWTILGIGFTINRIVKRELEK